MKPSSVLFNILTKKVQLPGSAGNPLKERGGGWEGEHKGRFSAQVSGCHASYNYNLQFVDSDIEAYLITIFSTPSLSDPAEDRRWTKSAHPVHLVSWVLVTDPCKILNPTNALR